MTQIFISKSIYFDIETGEEITKRVAKRDYDKLRTVKHIKTKDESAGYGTKHITTTIEWWHECERKRQLQIFR